MIICTTDITEYCAVSLALCSDSGDRIMCCTHESDPPRKLIYDANHFHVFFYGEIREATEVQCMNFGFGQYEVLRTECILHRLNSKLGFGVNEAIGRLLNCICRPFPDPKPGSAVAAPIDFKTISPMTSNCPSTPRQSRYCYWVRQRKVARSSALFGRQGDLMFHRTRQEARLSLRGGGLDV